MKPPSAFSEILLTNTNKKSIHNRKGAGGGTGTGAAAGASGSNSRVSTGNRKRDRDLNAAMSGGGPDPENNLIESKLAAPHWLTSEPTWDAGTLNYFKARPEYRMYAHGPRQTETDPDWLLRPHSEKLVYDEDDGLRTR
jgi:hypothetical protein